MLVGTTSVEKSELLSSLLAEQDIPHNLLNAKPENGRVDVAQAGRAGAVTIATNMAGRGTDIILGGNSDYMVAKLREVCRVWSSLKTATSPRCRSSAVRRMDLPMLLLQHPSAAAIASTPASSPTTRIRPWVSWLAIW